MATVPAVRRSTVLCLKIGFFFTQNSSYIIIFGRRVQLYFECHTIVQSQTCHKHRDIFGQRRVGYSNHLKTVRIENFLLINFFIISTFIVLFINGFK